MNDLELKQILGRCHDEISMLRERLAVAEAKARSYDALLQVLDLFPKQAQGFGEDVVWILKKELELVEARLLERAGQERPQAVDDEQ